MMSSDQSTGGAPRDRLRALLGWSAAAASVLLAGLIGWSLPRPASGPFAPVDNGLLAAGALAEALSQRISAEGSREQGVMIALSFRAGDGRYCRTFSLDIGLDGLACRIETGWLVEAIGRSPATGAEIEEPYRRASSALSPAVLAAISRWQAGDALTPEQERNIRSGGWR